VTAPAAGAPRPGPPIRVLDVVGALDDDRRPRLAELADQLEPGEFELSFVVLGEPAAGDPPTSPSRAGAAPGSSAPGRDLRAAGMPAAGIPAAGRSAVDATAALERLGGHVYHLDTGAGFPLAFRRLLRRVRPDVVQASAARPAGGVLALARAAGVRRRVALLRLADAAPAGAAHSPRRALDRRLVDACATHIVATSETAMRSLWRPDWRMDSRCRVIYAGLAAEPYGVAIAARVGGSERDAARSVALAEAARVAREAREARRAREADGLGGVDGLGGAGVARPDRAGQKDGAEGAEGAEGSDAGHGSREGEARAGFAFRAAAGSGVPILHVHAGTEATGDRARALRILAAVRNRSVDARLWLVGRIGAGERAALAALAAELGIAGEVEILGERAEISRLIVAASLVLVTSSREGAPNAVVEACAVATPVLSADLGEMAEIARLLPGVTMLPLAAADEAWAETARALTLSRPTRDERRAALRAFVHSPFTIEHWQRETTAVWRC